MGMRLPISPAAELGQIPTFDATQIPHVVRHGATHVALSTRNVGESMTLITPHAPIGALREAEEREKTFTVAYPEEGPENWRLRFTRTA